ncbi:MAG TPA: hypothetical protein ENN33_09830 [Ignavibacteria bacterium]|nr:hypothetical protein [Ignavibacteria bacterium]
MPNLDGTGPEGRGPLTGRKRGRCRDKDSSIKESTEKDDFVYGRGRGGRPRGGGFGFGGGRRRHGKGFGRGFGGRYGYGRRSDDDTPKDSNKDDEE